MLSQQSKILAVAVIASLALSACGKKKDLYGDPVPPPVGPTGAPSTMAKDGTGTITGGGLQSGSQSSAGGGLSNTGELPAPPELKPAPINNDEDEGDFGDGQGQAGNGGLSSGSGQLPSSPNVVTTRPVDSAPAENNTLPNYNPADPKNLENDGISKRTTGGVAEDGLVYTSSSTDSIIEFIRSRSKKVSYQTRELNNASAAAVNLATLNLDRSSGEAILTLKIVERGEMKVYNLSGSFGEGAASELRLVRVGNLEKTTGSRPVSGTLKCLDIDGGCENSFARLQIGKKGESSIINIIFRQSAADLYFSLNKPTGNREYAQLFDFAINTIQGARSENKADLNQVRLYSYEVVNGRSGFISSIKGLNRELLAFSGPLLAPEAGSRVNVSLARVTKDLDSGMDILSVDNYGLNYQNMIAEARLIANNGLGQIRILIKMRARSGSARDQFAITYLRKIKPIVELNDENLR